MRLTRILLGLLLAGCTAAPPTLSPTPVPHTSAPVTLRERSSPAPSVETRPQPLKVGKLPPPPASRPAVRPPAPPAARPSPPPPRTPAPTLSSPRLPEPAYPQAGGAPAPPPVSLAPQPNPGSARLDAMLQRGDLNAQFVGTGFSPQMISIRFFNPGSHPIRIDLVPGMILRPPGQQKLQPLLLAQSVQLTLLPGQSENVDLDSYCLDSRVPAPDAGQWVDYRFAQRTREAGSQVQKVLATAARLGSSRAATQIAIWKSMGQPVGKRQLDSVLTDPAQRGPVLAEAARLVQAASK